MAFSEQLASLMREATKKKSQRQIAKEAGVSQTTIGNMVMGQVPSKDISKRVAAASDIDEAALLIAAGYEQPPEDPLAGLVKKARTEGKMTPEKEAYIRELIQEIIREEDGEDPEE